MYTAYFGFRESPFNFTPNSRFLYTNPAYHEAYATLLYGIQERKGFVVLTGEVGTGKTTLLRMLMVNLEASIRFVFFYNTTLTFEELLSFTCEELSLPAKDKGPLEKIQVLNQFFIEQFSRGGTVALLIDEAQNLTEEVLENLRLLSNLETSGEKLLQIVLVGQPEFDRKLQQPGLRQLKQRIALHYHLDCLKDREVGPFINQRLRAVGYEREDLFTPEAIQRIALYVQGIPRLINILCDNALLIAYASSQKTISAAIIDEAAHDLRLPGKDQAAQATISQVAGTLTNGSQERVRAAEDESPLPKRKGLAWVGTSTILLLLGGGVVALSPLPSKDRLADFSFTGKNLLTNIGKHIGHVSADSHDRFVPPTPPETGTEERQDQTLVSHTPAVKFRPPSQDQESLHPQQPDSPDAQERAVPLDFSQPVELKGDATLGAAATGLSHFLLTPVPVGAWKEHPAVIQYGSTISQIAADVYGTNLFLAIDLLKEFNTHIGNLNWVLAGQKLWFPPLSQETLLRKQEDGSYRFILASFQSLPGAERFAQTVRRKGYVVSISPRRVSNSKMLYRVEIARLRNLEAANRAWDIARTNRWLVLG